MGNTFSFSSLNIKGSLDLKFMEVEGSLRLSSLTNQSNTSQYNKVVVADAKGNIETVSATSMGTWKTDKANNTISLKEKTNGSTRPVADNIFINDDGNVGIGSSSSAGYRLRVKGNSLLSGDIRVYGGIEQYNGNFTIIGSTSRVGIGTSNPGTRLHVAGGNSVSRNFSHGAHSWYLVNITGNSGTGGGSNRNNMIAYFDGDVWGVGFTAANTLTFSDKRIKNIVGQSDADADLAVLDKIQITDYTMKDIRTHGNTSYKKVIAQDLENIYPKVVQKRTDGTFIPDIYAFAKVKKTKEEGVYNFVFEKAVTLEKDVKKMRVHLADGTEKEAAFVAQPNKKTLRLKLEGYTADENMFVFGSEVYDFRTVDYDGLTTLNISATQALHQKIKDQQAEITRLKTQNEAIIKRLESLEKK